MPSFEHQGVSSCRTPCLVLAGNDDAHPLAISEEVAKLLPDAELIREWKEGAALVSATARMKQFLSAHTPAQAAEKGPAASLAPSAAGST
jgi:hypothetical protein